MPISTHALREEGDGQAQRGQPGRKKISTHALREEGDPPHAPKLCQVGISTHALREEGDGNVMSYRDSRVEISTHALREEGDLAVSCSALWGE